MVRIKFSRKSMRSCQRRLEAVAEAGWMADKEILSRQQQRYFGRPVTVLLGGDRQEIREKLTALGVEPWREQQLREGVEKRGARTIEQLNLLPKHMREMLAKEGFETGRSEVIKATKSMDGTRKFLLKLFDGRQIETVGIPSFVSGKNNLTVCVSSQVGCTLRCDFCATGRAGYSRNLMPHEILDQVLTVSEQMRTPASHVVFMGMGEPCLNIVSVLRAQKLLSEKMSGRSITISTVGVPRTIGRLADSGIPSTLAISLHAPTQDLREKLLPAAKAFHIDALLSDARLYFERTKRRISFEYCLLKEVNDEDLHAKQLGVLLRRLNIPLHVNLLPFNKVKGAPYETPSPARVRQFANIVRESGLPVTVRSTRGADADAACGQLATENQGKLALL